MRVAKQLVAVNAVIEALEYAGFEVFMQHEHFEKDPEEGYPRYLDNPDLPIRATTCFTVERIDENGSCDQHAFGIALCSAKDQFSPATGAQKAFSRCMQALSEHYGRDWMKELIAEYEYALNYNPFDD